MQQNKRISGSIAQLWTLIIDIESNRLLEWTSLSIMQMYLTAFGHVYNDDPKRQDPKAEIVCDADDHAWHWQFQLSIHT